MKSGYSLKSVVSGAALAAAMLAAPAMAADLDTYADEAPYRGGDKFAAFTSFSFTEDSFFNYTGLVAAVQGDLDTEGLLLRGGFTAGDYDYRLPGVSVDADVYGFDVMAGYQLFLDAARLTGYAGIDFVDTSLNFVDPTNPTRGSKTGAKFQAEIASIGVTPFYFSGIGSYSTNNDRYWARGRIGHNLDIFTIGPEFIALGNDGFDQIRVGGFADFHLPGVTLPSNLKIGVSAGYVDSSGRRGDDGLYGGLSLATTF